MVKFLHYRGICYGDMTQNNILIRLKDLSHLGKEEMMDLLGSPQLEPVETVSDVDLMPVAPRYKSFPPI